MSDRHCHSPERQNHRTNSSPYTFADHVRAAELAWDLWKSGDPRDWDRALDLKDQVVKRSPRAWEYAMREVNNQEEAERRRSPEQRMFQPGEKRGLRAYVVEGQLEIREAPDPYARQSNQMRIHSCRNRSEFLPDFLDL